MSNPTTPFNWQMPTSTDLVTDLPADFEVFGQAVATSMADLLGGTTGQVLKKNTNADMDFVWSADSAGMTNPMTTTGDTIYSSPGSTPARLAIGSTGNVLTVAGGVPTWAAPAAAGGMTLISETVASGLSSLSFTSLGSYKQLVLMYFGVRASDNTTVFSLRFNNNNGAVYPTSGIQVKNTSVESYAATPTSIKGDVAGAAIYSFGDAAAATGQTSTDVMGVITIDNYTSSTKYKMVHTSVNYYANGVGQYHAMNINSFFNDTTAITSLDIVRLAGTGTFSNSANTTIRLYGVS